MHSLTPRREEEKGKHPPCSNPKVLGDILQRLMTLLLTNRLVDVFE